MGRTIGLPVEVRRAAQWGAQYLVPAAAAQRIVGPTGLEVTGPSREGRWWPWPSAAMTTPISIPTTRWR